MAGASEGAQKRHSAFAQVVFRRLGETLDLGGKAVVGLGGFGSVSKARTLADIAWSHLSAGLVVGGVIIALGI